MCKYPLVSIFIPTYNRQELLKRAVNSVICQTYQNIELIVVDDGSFDSTRDYLCDISKRDERVKFYFNNRNLGACVSRNIAIENAKGIYITGLDDDDLFEPWRIEFLVEKFSQKFSFICTAHKFNYNSDQICLSGDIEFNQKQLFMDNLAGNQFFTYTSRLLEIGGFDSALTSSQDLDVMVRMCEKFGPAKRFQDPSYIICIDHGLPRISSSNKKVNGLKSFYKKHKKSIGLRGRVYYFFLIMRWSGCRIGKFIALPGLVLLNPVKAFQRVRRCF